MSVLGKKKKKREVVIIAGFNVAGECCVGRGTACGSVTSKVKNISAFETA